MATRHGVIRLSTECYTCYHWLPPLLASFHAHFSQSRSLPSIWTRPITQRKSYWPAIWMSRSCTVRRITRIWNASPLCDDELLVVMSPKHRLANRRRIEPQDLAGETHPDLPATRREHVTHESAGAGRCDAGPHHGNSAHRSDRGDGRGRRGSRIHGVLVGVAPSGKRRNSSAGALGDPGFHRSWYAVTLRNHPKPAYMTEFLNLLTLNGPKYMNRERAIAAVPERSRSDAPRSDAIRSDGGAPLSPRLLRSISLDSGRSAPTCIRADIVASAGVTVESLRPPISLPASCRHAESAKAMRCCSGRRTPRSGSPRSGDARCAE